MTAWKRAGREPRQLINEWLASLQRVAAERGDHVVMRVNRNWIAFRSEKDLRLVFETPECLAVNDAIAIALI